MVSCEAIIIAVVSVDNVTSLVVDHKHSIICNLIVYSVNCSVLTASVVIIVYKYILQEVCSLNTLEVISLCLHCCSKVIANLSS